MSRTIKVIGYHGTSREAAAAILAPGAKPGIQFLASESGSDWLGNGIYFFQDAPFHALEWPMLRMPEWTRITDPVVMCAEIDLTEHCLDLIDVQHSQFIVDEYTKLKARYNKERRCLPKNKGSNRRFDCCLINFTVDEIEKSGKRVDTIRAAFKEGKPIVPKSQIYSHAHIQVVVRPGRTAVISNVWLYNFQKGEDRWI